MATIKKREGKTGVSYLIRVSSGYDISGNQVVHSMTWRPEPGMTRRQIEKELQRSQTCGYGRWPASTNWRNAPVKYQAFFVLAIYGGFRRGELLGLEWQDIDFKFLERKGNNSGTFRNTA